MTQDSKTKRALITKLGQEVIVWNKTRGVVLNESSRDNFIVSLHSSGINWTDVVNIDLIEVYTGQAYVVSTKSDVIEYEDESCGSGGCKI